MADSDTWRGKVGGMTDEEVDEFLKGPHLCRLACLDEEGWPYIVPLWYQYRDGGYYVIPRARSVWAKHIQRDPRINICVDIWPSMQKVMARGKAEIVEEPNTGGKWVEIATEMSLRYLGENGPKYLEPTLVEPRWLIFLQTRFADDLAGRGLGQPLQARGVVAAANGTHRPEPAAGP